MFVIMHANKLPRQTGRWVVCEITFSFCFPITSYNIFHFSSLSLIRSQIVSLLCTRTLTPSLIYSFSQAHIALLSHPLCSINLPHFSPPVATSRADGVKTIFCESERCCVFAISYSWALLTQVRAPGLLRSGDAVAHWMWINENVTFNTSRWCHQDKAKGRERER